MLQRLGVSTAQGWCITRKTLLKERRERPVPPEALLQWESPTPRAQPPHGASSSMPISLMKAGLGTPRGSGMPKAMQVGHSLWGTPTVLLLPQMMLKVVSTTLRGT